MRNLLHDPDASGSTVDRNSALVRPAAPPPPSRPQGLLQLLRTLNTNPLAAWPEHHYEEPVVSGRTPLGRFAMVSDPDAIRKVLVEDERNYRKDDLQSLLLKPALGNGLLTSSGSAWRCQRRSFAPAFSLRAVGSYASPMWMEAEALSLRLTRFDDMIVDVAEHLAHSMLDTLARTLFSSGIGRKPEEFRRAATRYFETQGRIDPLDLLGAPTWIPRIGRLLSKPALGFFPKVVAAILAERRSHPRRVGSEDFLDHLLAARDDETGEPLSEDDIAANIITFIGAGFETPANALSWALYLLSLDDGWRSKVEREVDDLLKQGSDNVRFEDFVATRALLEESMRLYPPVAILSRLALNDHTLAGREIAKGTTVIISPWVLHRHRRHWDHPDHFDPARFMPERRGLIPRYTYLPFGAGPRVCIGAAYAMQQMTATLAFLAHKFRFDLAPGHTVRPVHRITLRPEGGMRMRVCRRR
ncbi:MAG: cytochrome P450 [Proteobacteria bacterium]|nr:cytochrome P450 [Pseudomonadota bacterium]